MILNKTYTPNDLAKALNVSKSTILYWEKMNYIPRAHRFNNLLKTRYWDSAQAMRIVDYYKENYV